jgi:hypothetical protein
MPAWGSAPASAIFQQAMLNPIAGRVSGTVPTSMSPTTGLVGDNTMAALFGTATSPDRTVAVGLTGYAAATSQWVTGNEITGGANWPAGGISLASKAWTLDVASSSICYQAAATAGTGNVTIAGAYGCLVYDHTISGGTVVNQGMCYNYFGGSQSVTAGTFTIVWATVGGLSNVVVFNITI